jgi:hypothetical protein
MLLVVINVLVIIVVGAILFWVIDKFVREGRLAYLLKILVVLICWESMDCSRAVTISPLS